MAVEAAQCDPRVAELRDAYLVPLGITSMLDASVINQGEIVGIVCHEHIGPPRDWTTEDRDFAMSVADAVTTKMKSAELLLAKSALHRYATLAPDGDRFEVLGRLAAGVAHDFKNLLLIVMGNASMITQQPELPPDVLTHAKQIEAAAERGAELINELIDFGREPTGTPRVLNVCEVVGDFIPLLRAAVGPNHTVAFTRESNAGKVLIDRGNLERAILNLVLNARDSMPSGGPIRIHAATERAAERDAAPEAYVRIDVQDSGTGIAAADRERIFDPFFTTKLEGKGTGLGLTSVRRVVERAGGFVRVESGSGEGTVLRLYLPRVTGEA
jgi:signal transduction histidine kinase